MEPVTCARTEAELARLLERIGARDERALERFHAMTARRIYAFVLHRLQDHADAETVVADTLYQVWTDAHKFRGDARVMTWVLGIARYKMLTLLRGRRRDHDDIDDHAETLASEEPEAPLRLMQAQAAAALSGCIERLREIHRECVHLVYFEGLALAAVSKLLDIEENTVKTRLFHARKQLQACVQARGVA